VYRRKQAKLVEELDSKLSTLFVGHLKNLHKACLIAFSKEVIENMHMDGYDFADVVTTAREHCEHRFTDDAKEAVVVEDDDGWNWGEELVLLKEDVRTIVEQLRKDETKKMVHIIEVSCAMSGNRGSVLLTPHGMTA